MTDDYRLEDLGPYVVKDDDGRIVEKHWPSHTCTYEPAHHLNCGAVTWTCGCGSGALKWYMTEEEAYKHWRRHIGH